MLDALLLEDVTLLDDEPLLAVDERLLLVLDASLAEEALLATLAELALLPDGPPPSAELPPEPPHAVSVEANINNSVKCNIEWQPVFNDVRCTANGFFWIINSMVSLLKNAAQA